MAGADFQATLMERRSPRMTVDAPGAGLRFAFYGRMSTEFQDQRTSKGWQRAVAEQLIDGFGSIVVEFFDEGRSRRWAWPDRAAASALLAAAERPDRGFDAVVVGEYERAFQGDQLWDVVARLGRLGVRVWLPEAGGPVELDGPVHQALMVLLGAQAQREVMRARVRAVEAIDHSGWVIESAAIQDTHHRYPFRADPPVIVKTRGTSKMASTSNYGERLTTAAEIYRALQVLDPGAVQGKTVLVVDDVFTTGLTLDAVARRLREAGATVVYGVTLARQPWG